VKLNRHQADYNAIPIRIPDQLQILQLVAIFLSSPFLSHDSTPATLASAFRAGRQKRADEHPKIDRVVLKKYMIVGKLFVFTNSPTRIRDFNFIICNAAATLLYFSTPGTLLNRNYELFALPTLGDAYFTIPFSLAINDRQSFRFSCTSYFRCSNFDRVCFSVAVQYDACLIWLSSLRLQFISLPTFFRSFS
jgi:hypothetical protein